VKSGVEEVDERVKAEEERIKEDLGICLSDEAGGNGIGGRLIRKLCVDRRLRRPLLRVLGRRVLRIEDSPEEGVPRRLDELCWIDRLCLVSVLVGIVRIVPRHV